MPLAPRTASEEIQLTVHPPERGQRPGPVTAACGCCCCCCCCLHTIGGLVGGISGSLMKVRPRPRPVDPSFPFPFRRDEFDEAEGAFPIAVIYWLLVLFLVAVVAVYFFFTESGPTLDPNNLWIGGLIALFCLPAIQLVASLLAVLVAAIFYTDKASALIRVGKITLWCFVGTTVGVLIMFALCGGMGMLGGLFR
jgi:hypothetical protein